MKKRNLLLMLLLAIGLPWAANAQTVTIGTGTSTQNMSPMANYYDLSFTEMIYTAEEIAAGNPTEDNILSVGFQLASNGLNSKTYSIAVYMKNYDADEFGTATFVSFASTDAVFTGTVTATTSGWVTIDLDSPFAYDNTKNLLIGVNKTAGGYAGSNYNWNYTSTSTSSKYQHLYKQQDGTNVYDPTNPPTSPSRNYNRPNVQLTFGVPPTCFAPQNLTCTEYTATSATLTWQRHASGTENAWVLQYSTDNTFATGVQSVNVSNTPSKQLTGLTAETKYYARVRPDCDENLWSDVCEFKPTAAQTVTIGSGTGTNGYLPTNPFYNYSYTQQIYTAAEIGQAGTIKSVSFKGNKAGTRSLTISMVNTDKEAFSSISDIIPNSEATQVFSGSVTFTANEWKTIELAGDGFDYDGDNLAVIVYDNTNNYTMGQTSWATFTATGNQAVYFYQDATITPSNPSANSQNVTTSKNQIILSIIPSSTPKPRNLQVTEKTSESATLTWEAPANATPMSYLYHYKKATDAYFNQPIDNGHNLSVTLNELAANTEYNFGVYANYSEGMSDYAEITFTTDATCLPVTNITVSDITSTGAKLAWTPGGSETSWQYLTLAHGDTPDWTSERVITSNTHANVPANIYACTGVQPQPNTEYDFYVRANCGGDYSEAAMLTFRTACGAITTFPWSETFESYAAGDFSAPCWVNEHISGDGTSIFKVTTGTNGSNSTHQLCLPDQDQGTLTKLVLPEMTLPNANYEFVIDVYRNNSTYTDDYASEGIRVYASTDGNLEGATELAFIPRQFAVSNDVIPSETEVGWYTYKLPIGMSGTCHIILRGESQYCTSTYMDNFKVQEVFNVTAYQIVNTVSNSEDEMTWDEFAAHVNAGHHFTHSTIELKESIANNQNPITTMVGTEVNPFTGTFDGKGHSINAMDIVSDEAGAAPFHYIKDATIKNLGVNGNVTQTNTTDAGYHTAGLVGFAWSGTNTIENCEVNTSITITTLGGGIVGHAKSSTLYLTGCYYGGGIENTTPSTDANRGVGGLVGWCDNATLYIRNCVYEGINGYSGDGSSVYFHPVACKTGGATVTAYVSNCYYLCDEPAADTDGANNVATTEGRKAYKVTGAEGITVDLPSAAIHYTCSGIWGDNTGSWNGIKFGSDIYGGEGKTLTLNLRGANGYAADHGTLTPSDGQYTLLMEAYDTEISGVSCPEPYNLAVAENGITNHTATIQWEGEHQGYQLWYRTAAYVDGTTEEFNSDPTDWTRYTGRFNETTGTATLSSSTISWYFNNSNGVFDRHAYSNIYGTGCYKWLVTPSIEVTSGYGLSFDVALTTYSYTLNPVDPSQQLDDKFIVLISTDDKATWTVLRKWDNAGSPYVYNNIVCSATGENVTLDLSAYAGTTAYIAFYGESTVAGGDNNLHLDNVAFGTLIPAGSWIDPNQPYLIEANSYTIEGLAAETPYEVEIRGFCGAEDGYSQETDIISFTTDIACPAPSALQIVENSVKSSQVGLSWTNGGAADWIVAYKLSTDTEFTEVPVATTDVTINGTTVTYTLTGLTPEKEYNVKVKDNCEASYIGDGTSDWSNTVTFTTIEACGQPTGVAVSNIGHYTAQVDWIGDSDGFKVKYRTAALINGGFGEEFPTNSAPSGWTRYSTLLNDNVLNGTTSLSSTTSGWIFNNTNVFGAYHTKLNIYGASCNYWLVTPEITLSSGSALQFDLALTDYNSVNGLDVPNGQADDKFVVLISTDDMATWTILREWNNSGSDYVYNNIATGGEFVSIDLSSYTGAVKIAFYGESTVSKTNEDNDMHIDNVAIGVATAAGEWQTVNVNGITTTANLSSLTPGTKYELVVVPNCDEDNASESVFFTTMSANHKLFITEGYWNVDDNWMPAGAPTVEQDVELRANVTIPSGYVATADIITGTGEGTGEGIYSLTIEDGGQLIFQNDNVNNHGPSLYATVKKNLSGYGAENAETNLGYHLISSPLRSTIYKHTSSSTPNITSTGLLTGNYDFYQWDYDASDELEWRNYKATPFDMTGSAYNTLYGYLYANENDVELTFTGQIEHNYNYGHYQSVRDWSDNYSFGAWWLLGNPFVCTAYVVSTTVDGTPLVTDATTAQPFYKMNGDGNGFTAVAAGTPVAPMEGIFYETTAPTGTYEKVFMSTITPAAQNSSKLNMNLRSNNKQLDNAILVFGGDQQLGKMTFRANSSKIFMPVEGKDYAITTAESNMGEMPVSFKAENNGTYSLSFTSEEVSFAYLHLIDNMTGNDVDLLETPSYTFDARTTDYESRFKLVFATGNNSNDGNFAFFSNGSFVINNDGEATLQVVDVTGRILKSESVNGCANINFNAAPGVYMLRLVNGDNVKVQKVVVK